MPEYVFLPEAAASLEAELGDDTDRATTIQVLFALEDLVAAEAAERRFQRARGVKLRPLFLYRSCAEKTEVEAMVADLVDRLLAGESDPAVLFDLDSLWFLAGLHDTLQAIARRQLHTYLEPLLAGAAREPAVWVDLVAVVSMTAMLLLARAVALADRVPSDPGVERAVVLDAPNGPPVLSVPFGIERAA